MRHNDLLAGDVLVAKPGHDHADAWLVLEPRNPDGRRRWLCLTTGEVELASDSDGELDRGYDVLRGGNVVKREGRR